MNRTSRLLILAALGLTLATTGCKKADDSAPATETAAAEAATTDPATAGEVTPDGAADTAAAAADPTADPAGEQAPPADAPAQPATGTTGTIIGSWNLDTQAMIAALPEAEREMAGAFMGMMQMNMTFGADNTVNMRVSMMGQEETESGTWESVSRDGDTHVIRITSSDGEVATLTIRASEPGVLRVVDQDDPTGEELVLRAAN